ncbi:hypothetical protein SprV_0301066500 [Sparganum proliferum]
MFSQLRVHIIHRLRQLWRRITHRGADAQEAISAAALVAANHLWMTAHAYRRFAQAAETAYKLPGFALFFRQLASQADAEAAEMARLVKTSPRPPPPPPPASPHPQEVPKCHCIVDCLRAGRRLEEENERQARSLYSKQTAAAAAAGAADGAPRQAARLAGTALTRLQALVRHLNGISAAGGSVYVYDRLTMQQQEAGITAESTQDAEEGGNQSAIQGDFEVSSIPA